MPCKPAAAPSLWEGREVSRCHASTLMYLFPKFRRDACISHSNHSHALQIGPLAKHSSYCTLSFKHSFYTNHFPFVRVPITDLVTLRLFNVLLTLYHVQCCRVFLHTPSLLCFLFWGWGMPWDMWDLSYPTRDPTYTPCMGNMEPDRWIAREVPVKSCHLFHPLSW